MIKFKLSESRQRCQTSEYRVHLCIARCNLIDQNGALPLRADDADALPFKGREGLRSRAGIGDEHMNFTRRAE